MCVSDLRAGRQLAEALAAGLRLQEEGGPDAERHREEGQHLGSTHFPEGSGTSETRRLQSVCSVAGEPLR